MRPLGADPAPKYMNCGVVGRSGWPGQPLDNPGQDGLDCAFHASRLIGRCLPKAAAYTILSASALYNAVLTFHNSGNSTTSSIRLKYETPEVPPVPRFSPITRSTVVTWLKRQRRK